MSKISKLMMGGIVSLALASAAVGPTVASAKPTTSTLTATEQSAAARLAESIVVTVTAAQAETRGLPKEQARLQIQVAVQTVIRNSGATPAVANAALDMAMARLASSGALDCINPRDKEESCNPAGMALASLSSILQSIVETAPAANNTTPGSIPIGAPVSTTPVNSGASDYRGS
jgi:hypothetical protein